MLGPRDLPHSFPYALPERFSDDPAPTCVSLTQRGETVSVVMNADGAYPREQNDKFSGFPRQTVLQPSRPPEVPDRPFGEWDFSQSLHIRHRCSYRDSNSDA